MSFVKAALATPWLLEVITAVEDSNGCEFAGELIWSN
jgi:hypothetical protein